MASTDREPFWYTYASFFTVCLYVLGRAETLPERFAIKPSSVDAADRENKAFMLLYLSPPVLVLLPLRARPEPALNFKRARRHRRQPQVSVRIDPFIETGTDN
jgi:hypothetical protein